MIKNKVSKIIFIGGNRYKEDGPFIGFAKQCLKNKIDIVLLIDKVRLKYPTKTMGSLKDALEQNNIPYEVVSSISKEIILKHKREKAMIFSVHCRWIIKEDVLKLFPNMIFNYHNLSLPEQRGAAGHSWRLMQGNNKSQLNIHKISTEVDKGDIVLKKNIRFPKSCSNLTKCYKYIEKHEQKLFSSFLLLSKDKVSTQNERKSFYWPRLDTLKHGWIDWNWSAKEIKLFCSAFDEPFTGASTFVNNNRVFFTDAALVDNSTYFHPFQAGLVYRIINNYIFIATINGGIKVRVKKIKSLKGNIIQNMDIRLGDRFITPEKYLHLAKTEKCNY
ncbi:MAG: hypothetical protein CMD65_03640 [Gammaproteobacteria bacterium]|mgnify:CR=1 FL=1|nr:hypothetical protein [Gammaproteobacteria bacterium]|tara:strand:+ start:1780 stop:2772 length:993 start_codon:yes stop_codon:yes gene_type:complete